MNTSDCIIDASATSMKRGELGDVSVPRSTDFSTSERTRVLRASQLDLTSLVVGPESSLSSIVQHITTLDVSHNQISSLHGIESFIALETLNLSYNLLHVIDSHSTSLLHCLVRLKSADFSHNRIMLIDLNASSGGRSKAALSHEDIALNAFKVTSLNLSHNSLIELPDLRYMLNLQVLNLSYNTIEDLSDIDTKLPLLSLHTFRLSHNRLQSVSSLVALSALASTLRHIELEGNLFTMAWIDNNDRVEWVSKHINHDHFSKSHWWRPFVLWLLPLTVTLDTLPYTQVEQQVAVRLFREGGKISKNLTKLMNPQYQKELASYLWEQSKHVLSCAEPRAIQDVSNSVEEQSRTEGSPAATQRSLYVDPVADYQRSSLEPRRGVTDSAATQNSGNMSIAIILRAIQNKLRSLSDVVHVLWQQDVARRTRAAVIIQRYTRGALTRNRLPEAEREFCKAVRLRMACAKWNSHRAGTTHNYNTNNNSCDDSMNKVASAVHTSALSIHANGELATRNASETVHTENYTSGIEEVVTTMRTLQEVMMMMWADLDLFRAMSNREQRRAATNIQRFYRGYVARKEWRNLKAGYDEFVESIAPYIHLLQRCGRGCLGRLRIAEQNQYRQEVRLLRKEVLELRHETREVCNVMKDFMRQQRLSQYKDPEQAMDEILEQHTQRV